MQKRPNPIAFVMPTYVVITMPFLLLFLKLCQREFTNHSLKGSLRPPIRTIFFTFSKQGVDPSPLPPPYFGNYLAIFSLQKIPRKHKEYSADDFLDRKRKMKKSELVGITIIINKKGFCDKFASAKGVEPQRCIGGLKIDCSWCDLKLNPCHMMEV